MLFHLGMLVALNENEIGAAMEADKHGVDGKVAEYAKMLHTEHGKNVDQTIKVGQQINTAPLETPESDKLRRQGAAELAQLVPLKDDKFEAAYIAAMVKGHQAALNLIDQQLLPKAKEDATRKHLKDTRTHVAAHLKAAREIQSGQRKSTASR